MRAHSEITPVRTREHSRLLLVYTERVKVEDAQRRVYNTFSADRMRLLGYALEKR